MMIDPKPGAWVWPASMIVWGPGSTSARHSHHGIQLVMVLQGKLRIRSGPGDPWRTRGAALVRPDANHEVDARGRTLLIGFVDPESELGTVLMERIKSDISHVPATQVEQWRLSLGSKLTPMRVERWVRQDRFCDFDNSTYFWCDGWIGAFRNCVTTEASCADAKIV